MRRISQDEVISRFPKEAKFHQLKFIDAIDTEAFKSSKENVHAVVIYDPIEPFDSRAYFEVFGISLRRNDSNEVTLEVSSLYYCKDETKVAEENVVDNMLNYERLGGEAYPLTEEGYLQASERLMEIIRNYYIPIIKIDKESISKHLKEEVGQYKLLKVDDLDTNNIDWDELFIEHEYMNWDDRTYVNIVSYIHKDPFKENLFAPQGLAIAIIGSGEAGEYIGIINLNIKDTTENKLLTPPSSSFVKTEEEKDSNRFIITSDFYDDLESDSDCDSLHIFDLSEENLMESIEKLNDIIKNIQENEPVIEF